jgi:DNA-binding response OmpR family regulator
MSATRDESSAVSTAGGKKWKILLAEDDKFISRAYSDGLTRAGFEVMLVEDGIKALEYLRKDCPHLLLLDIIMPGKNGFDVLAEMKTDGVLCDIPVLILSNLGQDSDIQKAKELGAADFLVKSNNSMQEVIAKVRETLAKLH